MLTARLKHTICALTAIGTVALGGAVASGASGGTETIRAFSKNVSITLSAPDGTVVEREPQAGDVLDVNSLNFKGDHRRHARHAFSSTHLRCVFAAAGEPDCISHTAIGGSLLVFHGNPGTLINGTGRYQGATGRAISNKEVVGGNDIVVRIQRR